MTLFSLVEVEIGIGSETYLLGCFKLHTREISLNVGGDIDIDAFEELDDNDDNGWL